MKLQKNQPCPSCGRYDNRGISIDAVVVKGNKVLLIKRGEEPFKGYWATPGGFVGWDETVEQALVREFKEETNLKVADYKLIGVYSSPDRHPNQVINVLFKVVAEGKPKHGDDAVDIRWFDLNDLPDKMAFDHEQNIKDALKSK